MCISWQCINARYLTTTRRPSLRVPLHTCVWDAVKWICGRIAAHLARWYESYASTALYEEPSKLSEGQLERRGIGTSPTDIPEPLRLRGSCTNDGQVHHISRPRVFGAQTSLVGSVCALLLSFGSSLLDAAGSGA